MTQIFAHRGSRINRPENTLAAFEEALRVGTEGIELDVQLSKDGQVVVIHDTTIDRTTNGRGAVADMSVAELQVWDAGSWFDPLYHTEHIPTLQEVFDLLEAYDFSGCLNIELKTADVAYPGLAKAILTLLASKPRDVTVVYSSFNLASLFRIYLLNQQVELVYLALDDCSNFLLRLVEWLPFISSLHLSRKWYKLNKRKINKHLRLWTVNDETDMKAAFDAGIAGIITDKPEVALNLKRELAAYAATRKY